MTETTYTEESIGSQSETDFQKFIEGFTPLSAEFMKGDGRNEHTEQTSGADMGQIAALMEAIQAESQLQPEQEVSVNINAVQDEKKGVGRLLQAIKSFFKKMFGRR